MTMPANPWGNTPFDPLKGGYQGQPPGFTGTGPIAGAATSGPLNGIPNPQATFSDTPAGYVGNVPNDRLRTSSTGQTYIGGMTPVLPTANLSSMWGSTAANPGYTPQDLADAQALLAKRAAMAPAPPAVASGGSSGGSSGGMSGISNNRYLSGSMDNATRRTQDFLNDNFNQIRSNAVGVGGLGGSRQGVAEGVATARAADSLQGNWLGQMSGDYNAEQNRELSRYGIDIGDRNTNRQLDLAATDLGSVLEGRAIDNEWKPTLNATDVVSRLSGYSGSTSNNSSSGGGWLGALGGAIGGATAAKQWGWI